MILCTNINSDRYQIGQIIFKHFINLGSNSVFTCILPEGHKSPKEFWKNSHFENMRADFLRRCQNSLWQTRNGRKMANI